MDGSTVALAAIGFASSMGLGIIWVVKYLAKELSKDLREHTRAAIMQQETNKGVQAAIEENTTFMRNLNGKLATATIQTIKEQHIGTQNVTETKVVEDRRKGDTSRVR